MKDILVLFITLLPFIFSDSLSGQYMINKSSNNMNLSKGLVKGIVFDSSDAKPISSAIVILSDSVRFLYTSTNDNGEFSFAQLRRGNYGLKISLIGYNSRYIVSLKLNNDSAVVHVGKLILVKKTILLPEITISGEKKAIEVEPDKITVNVDKLTNSSGGTLLDVLKNIPMLVVDYNGNVSFKGSKNLKVLIDGKSSPFQDMKLLGQIPESTISQIEIHTNPSARFDPEGDAGLINIIYKKSVIENFNGSLNASAGIHGRYNSSLILSYKTSRFNVFGNYGNSYGKQDMTGSSNTKYFGQSDSYLLSNNGSVSTDNSHNIGLGFDYVIDNRTSISSTIRYNIFDRNNVRNSINSNLDSLYNQKNRFQSTYNYDINKNDMSINLSYLGKLNTKGRLLSIDFFYNKNGDCDDNDNKQSYISQSYYSFFDRKENTATNNKFYSLQADYDQPVFGRGILEAGLYSTFRLWNRDYEAFTLEDYSARWIANNNSNVYKYHDQIYAIYFSLSNNFNSIRYKVGLRLEKVFTNSLQETTNQKSENNYFSYFPSVQISNQMAGKHHVRLSFNRRITRPGLFQLNPFFQMISTRSASEGNPYLNPSYTNSFDLGYHYFENSMSLMGTVSYRNTRAMITNIYELRGDSIMVCTYRNLKFQNSYGINCFATIKVFQWWEPSITLNYNMNRFISYRQDGNILNSSDSWSISFLSNLKLIWDIEANFNINYFSATLGPQSKSMGSFYDSYGMRKKILDNKLVINLSASNLFSKQLSKYEIHGKDFYTASENKYNSMYITLSINYIFNRFNNRTGKKPEENTGSRELDGEMP